MIYLLILIVIVVELRTVYRRGTCAGVSPFGNGYWGSREGRRELEQIMRRRRMERGLE